MKKKINDYLQKHPIALMILIIGGLILLIVLSMLFTETSGGSEGLGGYLSDVAWRGAVAAIALFAGITICRICVAGIRNGANRLKGCLVSGLTFLAALVIIVLAMKGPIEDIPYLFSPEITYLKKLKYDIYSGESTSYYQVYGTDQKGNQQIFDLNEATYDEGKKFLAEDSGLMLKIWYLPGTEVVMRLQYLYDLDEEAYENRVSSELSDRLLSYELQINDTVYQVPVLLEELLQDGWTFKDAEDADTMIAPASAPWESAYDENPMIRLVNDEEQEITVFLKNLTDHDAPPEECVTDILSVGNHNLDYEGIDVILPGNIVLGWSDKDEVKETYGEPDEEDVYSDNEITYRATGEEYGHEVRMEFDDAGVLTSVWIQNEPEAEK